MSETIDKSQYVIPSEVPVCLLECSKAFNALEVKEKNYCHYLSKACEQGGLIVLLQTSPESVSVFLLLQRLFSLETAEELKGKALGNGVTEDEFKVFFFSFFFFSKSLEIQILALEKMLFFLNKEYLNMAFTCQFIYFPRYYDAVLFYYWRIFHYKH